MSEAPGANAPNPGMMPRRRPLPVRPIGAGPTHVPTPAVATPRRGWPNALLWADTGPLLAVAGRDGLLDAVLEHVEGRLRISTVVAGEVRRWARVADPDSAQLASWATVVVREVLDAGVAVIVPTSAENQVLQDDVLLKLRNLPSSTPTPQTQRKNAGEAASIAACTQEIKRGNRIVMLSNDGGARQVAAQYGVPVKDFGDLLKELVCAGRRTAEEAYDDFMFVSEYTCPPNRRWPKDADEMRCLAVDGHCLRCDALSG